MNTAEFTERSPLLVPQRGIRILGLPQGETPTTPSSEIQEIQRVCNWGDVFDVTDLSELDLGDPEARKQPLGAVVLHSGVSSTAGLWTPRVPGDPLRAWGRWFTPDREYARDIAQGYAEAGVVNTLVVPRALARDFLLEGRSRTDGTTVYCMPRLVAQLATRVA